MKGLPTFRKNIFCFLGLCERFGNLAGYQFGNGGRMSSVNGLAPLSFAARQSLFVLVKVSLGQNTL